MICHILTYPRESARKYPDRIALADAKTTMTYANLWRYVTSFGSQLAQRLRVTNRAVAVSLHHDVFDVLAFLSVAYSGNFYVPVDLSLPKERVAHMLEIAEPVALLTGERDRIGDLPCPVIPVPTDPQPLQNPLPPPYEHSKDTDPLYLIFTSGSTGIPKGVLINHRSVIDMAEQFQAVFDFPTHAVFGNQSPFDFDVSVKDIYLSLKLGGRLEILEKKLFSFPRLLLDRMNERRIDTIIWAVPALKIMSELDAFAGEKPQYLRDILFSGEVMPQKALAYWRGHYPNARFVNLYGPTEITCNCTYYILSEDTETPSLPIGSAFPNCSVFLLSGDHATADGEIGEICVSGTCLALGYYNNAEQTGRAFVPNPLNKAYRETIYRTGDLGRMENGLLYYMGRADTQIKHMGHRIELTEIELCANSCPGVEAAACVYDAEQLKIRLFFKGIAAEKELFRHLQSKLPRYMLPSTVTCLSEFPKTRTGKIDRRALLAFQSR